jgi:hypothetical protein
MVNEEWIGKEAVVARLQVLPVFVSRNRRKLWQIWVEMATVRAEIWILDFILLMLVRHTSNCK